jgi:Zn-dependent protease
MLKMLFTISEIFDVILMSLVVGYIFKDLYHMPVRRRTTYEPLDDYSATKYAHSMFWFAVLVTAPAIVLHEFGHKFMAMQLGFEAYFNASYFGLLLGVALKLMNTGLIFFIPAYVNILSDSIMPYQSSMIAFAGPFVNLVLWFSASYIYKNFKLGSKMMTAMVITANINKLLFIFNMIPIPGFDGFQVLSGIIRTFF